MATPENVLSILKAHEPQLRARGVARVALFGSLARGEAHAEGDADLMAEIDPAAGLDLWKHTDVVLFLQDMFTTSVDVANRQMLKVHVRLAAERDAVHAFWLNRQSVNLDHQVALLTASRS